MPILSAKRQVTLPKELCDRLQVNPGDDLDILEYNGRITVIKKRQGSASGLLKHLKARKQVTDEESLRDALEKKHPPGKRKKQAA